MYMMQDMTWVVAQDMLRCLLVACGHAASYIIRVVFSVHIECRQ